MTTVLARLYDAVCALYDCCQGDRTVDTYAEEFRTLYDRVLLIIPPTTDPVKKEEQRKMLRIVYFLRGLRPEFGPARARVLNREPAPTYDEMLAEMIQYESYLNESVGAGARQGSSYGSHTSSGGRRGHRVRSRARYNPNNQTSRC